MDPVAVAGTERRRDIWLAVAVCCTAVALAALVMTATATAYNGAGVRWVLLVVVVAGVMGFPSYWKPYLDAKKKADRLRNPEESGEGDMLPEQMMGNSDLMKLAQNSNEVVRLCQIVARMGDYWMPDTSAFSFTDEGALEGYRFYSAVPGKMATESQKNQVADTLSAPLGDGWQFSYDSTDDSFSATKHDSLPSLVAPPARQVVTSAAQAAEMYDESEVHPGIGEEGEIAVRLKRYVHWFIPGGTGGGKSVLTRALMGERLALGHRFFILDGKTTDYTPFTHTPNISAISTTPAEHVILIHKVAEILRHRQQVGKKASRTGDTSWRHTMTPITMIIDEWADARNTLSSKYSKELKAIDRDIETLLKVGREFRVHLLFSSQGTEAKTIPTDWFLQMKTVISAGPPSGMTINKAFPEDARGAVSRIGGQISPSTPGRAMVALTDPDSGKVKPYLFQSYYSYSPGDPLEEAPGPIRPQWEQFKTQVYDRLPRLYPREWVKPEYPEPKEGKDPYSEKRDDGWVDLEELTVADLHRLKPVALEDPENGFATIEENRQYDPLDPEYLGEPLETEDDGAVIDI